MDRSLIEHSSWSPWQLAYAFPLCVFAIPFIFLLDAPRGTPGVLIGWIGLSLTVLLGLLAMGWRTGFRVDATAGTFERWHASLFLRTRKGGSVDAYRQVELTLLSARSSTALGYAVALGDEDRSRLRLGRFREHDAARAIAEQIARDTGKPLVDCLGEEPVELAPRELPTSLRERLRRAVRSRRAAPEPPAQLRSRIERAAGRLHLEVPPPELIRRLIVPLLVVVAIEVALVVGYFGLDRGVNPALVPDALRGLMAIAYFAAPVVIAALLLAAGRQGPAVVDADPSRLRVELRRPLGDRWVEIRTEALTDLLLSRELARGACPRQAGRGKAIVARGGGRSVAFGGHLSEGEKRWLESLLKEALTA